MKVLLSVSCALFLMIVGLSSDASAQTRRGHSINKREHNQKQRIVKGVKNGDLTARETYRLGREQYRIRKMEDRFRDSGNGLSYRERFKLQRELNQSSRHIYRQKHDQQNRKKP